MAKQKPYKYICGNYSGQGEGNADAEEIAVIHLISLFSKNADAGNVGTGPYGGQITAERGTYQKAKIQWRGRNWLLPEVMFQ